MFKKKIYIGLVFGLTFFYQQYVLAETSTKIVSLGSVPDGYTILTESLKYSADMKHVTYVMRNDKNQFFVQYDTFTSRPYFTVFRGTPYFTEKKNRHAYIASTSKNDIFAVVDGKPGTVFDELDNLGFSPDESRFAYRAVKGDRQCVVIDHSPQPFYDGIPIKKNLIFSPDSTRLAYVAYQKENNHCLFILDGKELKAYKFIEHIRFSPDSEQYAYMAKVSSQGNIENWQVVRNGQESEIYNKIFMMEFSPDSKHFAFVAQKNKQMALVIDNKEIVHDKIGAPVFSLDSKRMAYAFQDSKKWRLNIDGEDGPELDQLLLFFFSPDSKQFSYIGIDDEKHYCYLNHKISGPAFDAILNFKFSPNSKRYIFEGFNKGSDENSNEKNACVVVDGKPGNIYPAVGECYFTPDSKKIIYKAFRQTPYAWFTVVDDQKIGRAFFSIDDYFISPDSNHLAFRGLIDQGKAVMVVDEKIHNEYQIVGKGFFSPDSKHLVYHAMKKIGNEEKWYLVVDGNQLPEEYDGFIKGTPIIFDSDNQFHTIGLRSPGAEFLVIEFTIPDTWKIDSRK